MNRAPTSEAIYAAELKVAQHRLQTHAALQRSRIKLRAAVRHPATLAALAGIAALFIYRLTHRTRSEPKPAHDNGGRVKIGPAPAFMLAFVVSYAKQRLAALLERAWENQHKNQHENHSPEFQPTEINHIDTTAL